MIYTKAKLDSITDSTIARYKELLEQGINKEEMTLTIEGKEVKLYIDCAEYIAQVNFMRGIRTEQPYDASKWKMK